MGCWKFIRKKRRRLAELSGGERAFLVHALLLLPLTAFGLRLVGFQRYHAWLMSWAARGNRRAVHDSGAAAQEVADMVGVAARYSILGRSCLPQAMVLSFLLRRMGLASELRIGVRHAANEFQAHAWIERNGLVLNDTADVHRRFAAFSGPICPAFGSPGQ